MLGPPAEQRRRPHLAERAFGLERSRKSGAKTKTTTVTCNAHDAAGNNAAAMSLNVTVHGVHDQIAALESEVNASAGVAKARKASLVSDLVRADRFFAADNKALAKSQLGSFIATVLHLPSSLRAATIWIAAATRIIAVGT